MNIKQIIPVFDWLPHYTNKQFNGDLSAGLTVGVMLIPQGMAYAMIAGLPPIYGLYAATLPLIIYAFLGTSRQLAVGPVAMVSLLTAAGIGTIAEGGTELYISLAITLAFMVGTIQFLLGVFRLGFLVNFLSHPVISGFTSAAALIIGLSQLKHLLGVDISRTNYVHEILLGAVQKFSAINWITLAIGIGGIFIIKIAKKISSAIPSQLVAVIFGIGVVMVFGLTEQGVKIVGEVPSGLPVFSMPDFNLTALKSLLPIALAIALVSFMESIAVAKSIQSKHKDYEIIPNQELIALGLANVGGSFLQAYPVTGGFSRTAVNDQAGAKTGMAAIISAFLIVLTLLFLTPLFYYLPQAILAAVIMVAVFDLIDLKETRHLWQANRSDFWMLVVTFVGTLILGIEEGIGIGVILSLAMIIFRITRPHVAELGQVPNTHYYRNVERFQQIATRNDKLILRFDAQLYFANTQFFKETITRYATKKGAALKTIILNFDSINNVDSSATNMLEEVVKAYRINDVKVLFTGVKGPVRDAMEKTHLIEIIGEQHFFMSVQKAVDFVDNQKNGVQQVEFKEYVLQTN